MWPKCIIIDWNSWWESRRHDQFLFSSVLVTFCGSIIHAFYVCFKFSIFSLPLFSYFLSTSLTELLISYKFHFLSRQAVVGCGVPQGYHLGPLSFLILSRIIASAFKHFKYLVMIWKKKEFFLGWDWIFFTANLITSIFWYPWILKFYIVFAPRNCFTCFSIERISENIRQLFFLPSHRTNFGKHLPTIRIDRLWKLI